MAPAGDGDDTVRLTPPRRKPRVWLAAGLGAVLATLAGAGVWFALSPRPVVAPAPAPVPGPVVTAPPPALAFPVVTAGEAEILAHRATQLTIYRLASNPRILVLDFPDLHQQAQMLNRVAALVEKSGLPRERVLTDAELDGAIRAHGDTADTYYYGHDYAAADLARFFALADRDAVPLTAEEELLRALLRQEGQLNAGSQGAVISVPREGSDALMDAAARATILHHELAHGEYFSNPAYAAYVHRFWSAALGEADREVFRRFLGNEGYDPAMEDLMINEMQAYLMHTADPRFFSARALGVTEARLTELRAAFLSGMPAGWLRDSVAAAGPLRVSAPRRVSGPWRAQRAAVSRIRARPLRRALRRTAASTAA